MIRRAVPIAVLAALALPGAAAAQGPAAATLTHLESIPPGGKTFTVTCPRGYVATAGATKNAGGLFPDPGTPVLPRGYRFSFSNISLTSATVTVIVRCVRRRFRVRRPPGFTVGPNISGAVLVRRGQKVSLVVTCEPGSAPTGIGQSVAPVSSPRALGQEAPPAVELATARPETGRWRVVLFNVGGDAEVRVHVVCARRRGFRITAHRFVERVEPGPPRPVEHRCPGTRTAVGAGHVLPETPAFIHGQDARGRGTWRWDLQNSGDGPAAFELTLLCLRALAR